MLKRSVFSGLILVLLLTLAGNALAQDISGMRVVCVLGYGCAYTHLTNEQLAERSVPGAVIVESGGDFTPEGNWEMTYEAAPVMCTNTRIEMPAENQTLNFSLQTVDAATGDQELVVEGIDEAGVESVKRLGPGVFVSGFPVVASGVEANFYIYMVMTSETEMRGMLSATWTVATDYCEVERLFSGTGTSTSAE